MKKIMLLTILISLPLVTLAAGLVPCGGPAPEAPCELRHFLILAQKIINFLTLQFMPVATAAGVAVGGIWILISGGNETYRKKGKDIINMSIWGAIIVMISWLIVNEIMLNFATGPGIYTPWTSII